jgi:hypothetical protein
MARALRIYLLSYPFASVASLFCTWFAARFSLGHWPRPYLDDPKQIEGWFYYLFLFARLLFEVGDPAFLIGVCIVIYLAIRDVPKRKEHLRTVLLSLLFMAAVNLFLRWDPWRIWGWFMD